ncbi:MAG: YdeI/OmpD-associated family protein [Chloroflexi bacterium]|nr:YdeI/OmpD-associated family protein [Chloroflexota bacterium]
MTLDKSKKKILNTLHVTNRKEWRAWLRKHYKTEKEIWLVYARKETGEPRISYNDAVEEALCFGWIDSTFKTLDEKHTAQRFSPRRPKSGYSLANKERLKTLIKQGKVIKDVRETLGFLFEEKFQIPADILEALQESEQVWQNFQKFSAAYQRIRIGFIEGARNRPEEFQKRLRYFIKMTEKNKQYGFGGIEKHF